MSDKLYDLFYGTINGTGLEFIRKELLAIVDDLANEPVFEGIDRVLSPPERIPEIKKIINQNLNKAEKKYDISDDLLRLEYYATPDVLDEAGVVKRFWAAIASRVNALLARRKKALETLDAALKQNIKEGDATDKKTVGNNMIDVTGKKTNRTAFFDNNLNVTGMKFSAKAADFKYGANARPLVFMGLSNLSNDNYDMVVAAEKGWSFVSQNIDGIWMNYANTESKYTEKNKKWPCQVLNATKAKSVILVTNMTDDNDKEVNPYVTNNAVRNIITSMRNYDNRYDTGYTSLNVVGSSIVTDYIEQHPVWTKTYLDDVKKYYGNLAEFELPDMSVPLWPSTRVNWWGETGPHEDYLDIVNASNGVVLESAPLKFLADHEDYKSAEYSPAIAGRQLAAMKNCVQWCRANGKPVVWLAPKGDTQKYLDTMKKTWELFEDNACQPDAVVVINYEPGENNNYKFGPERNGTASTNTLTGVARWLMSGQ